MSVSYAQSAKYFVKPLIPHQPNATQDIPAFAPSAGALTFRGYRVYPSSRQVLLEDREISLGGRAFDLLVVLLRARGKLVSKDEIIHGVWPSTTVDDSNLRFQMATLRKALSINRDVIKTVPGRGYMIAEDCDQTEMELGAPADERPEGAQSDSKSSNAWSRMFSRANQRQLNGRLEPNPFKAIEFSRTSSTGGELADGDLNQRLAELERENVWLKLAIANLTLRRLAQIVPLEAASGH
jgi:DNA-binding winged helix-turn-helix (wHTH) protein